MGRSYFRNKRSYSGPSSSYRRNLSKAYANSNQRFYLNRSSSLNRSRDMKRSSTLSNSSTSKKRYVKSSSSNRPSYKPSRLPKTSQTSSTSKNTWNRSKETNQFKSKYPPKASYGRKSYENINRNQTNKYQQDKSFSKKKAIEFARKKAQNPRSPDSSYAYVLKLQSGRYYVGYTSNPKRRMLEHFGGNGSKVTKQDPPVKIHRIIECDSEQNARDAESIIYHKMKSFHGLSKVRGAGNNRPF